MKLNVKGLVFVGFAAAVFASAANAAEGDNKKVTSLAYTDATYQKQIEGTDGQLVKSTGTKGTVGYVTMDTTPTQNSTNPITSGAVYSALGGAGVQTAASIADGETGYTTGDQVFDYAAPITTTVKHTASTAAGSATQPVYIAADGTATATTYELNKTVPADAVFTDHTYTGDTDTIAVDANGQISAVTTGGVAANGTNLVTGDQVNTAISNAISGAAGSYQAASAAGEAQYVADGTGGWEALEVDDSLTQNGSKPVASGAVYAAVTTIQQDLALKQNANTAVTHTQNTAAGSATQPVYIAPDGTATATTYELNATVPANAVFTDHTYSGDTTTIAVDANGQISAVTTGGVAANGTNLVTGGQVATAITNATSGKLIPTATNCSASAPCALVATGESTFAW